MGTRIALTDGTRIFSLWTLLRVRWCFQRHFMIAEKALRPYSFECHQGSDPWWGVMTGVLWRGCYLGKRVVSRHQKHLSSYTYIDTNVLYFSRKKALNIFEIILTAFFFSYICCIDFWSEPRKRCKRHVWLISFVFIYHPMLCPLTLAVLRVNKGCPQNTTNL